MKGKLIKKPNHNREYSEYWLYCEELKYNLSPMAKTGVGHGLQKLSLKNCQEIERAYDLDELADEHAEKVSEETLESSYNELFDAYEKGFQKALELMGDKKFTEKDVKLAINLAWDDDNLTTTEIIQSLQQNEWEVEIEMIGPLVYPANLPKEGEERPAYRPKIDVDGCLILKRI